MWRLKHGHCKWPECEIDLGMVPVATQYCSRHKIESKSKHEKDYRREQYKSKYGRLYNIKKEVYRDPEPVPKGLKEGGLCPGNGNGFCGARIYKEHAFCDRGFIANFFIWKCFAGHSWQERD